MTGWGAGWDKGDTRFPRHSPVAEAGEESLCLHSHSPLSPFQLRHAIPSPTAVSVALVHINSAEPLSCKESLSGSQNPHHRAEPSPAPACLEESFTFLPAHFSCPAATLADFLSLHGQSSFPSQRNFPSCSLNQEGSSSGPFRR